MSEKFANQYGKRILQCKREKISEKINIKQHKSLFHNEGICRFNRMLKNYMWKQFTHNGIYKWFALLLCLVSKYNARKHQTIGVQTINMTPTIADKLLNMMYSSVKAVALPRFKVGDSVRVGKFKMIFERDYTPNWPRRCLKLSKYRKLIL